MKPELDPDFEAFRENMRVIRDAIAEPLVRLLDFLVRIQRRFIK